MVEMGMFSAPNKNSIFWYFLAVGSGAMSIFAIAALPKWTFELGFIFGAGAFAFGLIGFWDTARLRFYRIFPSTEEPNASPRPDIRVKHAISYLCHESKWDRVTGDTNDGWHALRGIMEAASTGHRWNSFGHQKADPCKSVDWL